MELNNRTDRKYKMTLANQHAILSVYHRLVTEHDEFNYSKGGNPTHYKRMKRALQAGKVICFKCLFFIELDQLVRSKRGKNFTKIWHQDCYNEY
jgi:hypothetical protein